VRELKDQLVGALLVILTSAAVVAAALNLQQQNRFRQPDDGVTWVDEVEADGTAHVVARHVAADSAAEHAGIRAQDRLLTIDGRKVDTAAQAVEYVTRLGAWKTARYRVARGAALFEASVIVSEGEPDLALWIQYVVGAAYLGIGLFVYFRRGNAPKAVHFYLLCLVSFILSTFHYTGKLNNFDKVIYWGNVVAGALAPAIFAHFTLVFPERAAWLRRRGSAAIVYLPALVLVSLYAGFALGLLRSSAPLVETRWALDRLWLGHLVGMYLAGTAVVTLSLRRAEDPVQRRQLTFLRNGALFGVAPFAALYALPYLMGAVPAAWMKLSVVSLILVPLTWAYAILRYRLMDVDIIFQQGYVYTLATLAVLSVFFGMLFALSKTGEVSAAALVAMLLIATFVFQPIRKWMQEQLDRYYFYRDRYDYRRTLVEFARELSAQTELDPMLESVAERLIRTLSLRQVAVFLGEDPDGFRLHMLWTPAGRQEALPRRLDLSFLTAKPQGPYLFFERTRNPLDVRSRDLTSPVRDAIAQLDLTYYLPCSVRGRTIAYLGVSRTEDGDFLSSDDVELLVTLSGYVGIAIDNALLYRSLKQKAQEFERLKEFSENIVESINVGILAADLEDRVESWNSQMERLLGIERHDALGRRLGDLLPGDLMERLEGLRGERGVHNIYKQLLRLEGREDLTVNVAIAPLVARDGDEIGRLIIFDDITDRAELEKRLVQADKLSSIGLLAAGVAHEVNTPLAVISTYAQMLAKQVGGDEQKSKLLDKIARQTFRASEIVNSLLNFSRVAPTEFVEVDLNRVVRETVTLVEHQLQKARVEVEYDLTEPLPALRGSPGKLQQVFLNLILNARDAMEGGGSLRLRTWMESGAVRVEVADTGIGIAAENLTRIFDPFYTTKGVKKGTGLGLSVTYGIVQEHGGEIEVDSELGRGTRFRIEFPLQRSAPRAGTAPAAPPRENVSAAANTVP
jgi:PAS domain S-box-containing protein